ncbi:MAG: hydroxymethylbilane synthase [Ginsengibacter sp.]
MKQSVKIGTRDSQLAVWQATLVQNLLREKGVPSEIVFIKSEGDLDTVTPLYELGVQGIFTRSLDTALLNKRVDIAVHSLKDVPTRLADGLCLAAVLKRASYNDLLIYKDDPVTLRDALGLVDGKWSHSNHGAATVQRQPLNTNVKTTPLSTVHNPEPATANYTIATSSIRRMAQWLHRYPGHTIENLRGNVNTRLQKLNTHNWNGAIFAAAGLERIHIRPQNSVNLDWMLPAPAQGAITIACRSNDGDTIDKCQPLNDPGTALCTKIERDFLRALLGGCSTPISALAEIENHTIIFKGNICSPDGLRKIDIEKTIPFTNGHNFGVIAADELLRNDDAQQIIYGIRSAKK